MIAVFRLLNGLMAVLFAVAVVVQFNDPDPLRWVAVYGAALTVSALAAARIACAATSVETAPSAHSARSATSNCREHSASLQLMASAQ